VLNTGDTEEGLYAIVLAAGASTRFGSAKQLVRIAGRPLLHTTVSRAVAVTGSATFVVLGAHAVELAPLLKHTPASIVINHHWRKGIGSSIRAGVERLPATCTGVMLVLADQAAVSAEDLQRLASTWRRQTDSITAALYAGTVGVPAIFPRSHFGKLADLRGDVGARKLLHRSNNHLVRVPMESAALDIDTPEDLLAIDTAQAKNI
jgi:molybdenum cofactor cytidylyltransferase